MENPRSKCSFGVSISMIAKLSCLSFHRIYSWGTAQVIANKRKDRIWHSGSVLLDCIISGYPRPDRLCSFPPKQPPYARMRHGARNALMQGLAYAFSYSLEFQRRDITIATRFLFVQLCSCVSSGIPYRDSVADFPPRPGAPLP